MEVLVGSIGQHCQTWPACLFATVSADSKPPPSTEYYLDGGSICLLFSILLAGSVNLIAKTISASQSCLSDLLCTFFILSFWIDHFWNAARAWVQDAWPCMCVRCPSSQLTPNLRQRLVAAWWLMEPLALVHFFIDPSCAKSAPALELDICTIRGDNGAAVIVLPAAALPPHNCSVWCECDEWWQWSDVSRVSTVSSQQPQCHYCDHCPIIICPRVRLKMTTHLAAGNIWCLSSRNELRLLWELDIQTSKARESFYNLVFAEDSRSISIYIDIDCLL